MLLLLSLLACSDSEPSKTEDTASSGDTGAEDSVDTSPEETGTADTGANDTGADTGDSGSDTGGTDTGDGGADSGGSDESCRDVPAAADRARKVLISLPYSASGGRADVWALLELDREGRLRDPGTRLSAGRASGGNVAFTPDGSLAFAASERGALVVIDVAAGRVVESAWDGGFSATSVTVDPSGSVVWVVDGNWPEHGGGLWRVDIDCATGSPLGAERVLEAKNPAELVWIDDTRAALVGREIPGTPSGADLAWLTMGARPSVTGGVDAFGDEDAIVSDAVLAGSTLLLGDNGAFSGIPNRVARVGLDGSVRDPVELEDPMGMAGFPDGSARALVASGFGDALYVFDASSGRATTLSTSPRVQLPGPAAQVTRGALAGLTLVSEVGGLRSVQLSASGATDRGVFSLGSGTEHMVGAIGVAP
jgi:hypothetical protein